MNHNNIYLKFEMIKIQNHKYIEWYRYEIINIRHMSILSFLISIH